MLPRMSYPFQKNIIHSLHIMGVSGHQDLIRFRNSVKRWFHGLPQPYGVHVPFHTSSTEYYPCRASQNQAESQGLRVLMSTLPVSCYFKPSPATAGATLSPLRRSFLGLSVYLVSPHPAFLQHPPTLHLHAHTAVLSQLIHAASVLLA